MARNKAEKMLKAEEKKKLKEKQKRIEQANKMLLPVSKQTNDSLGLISFDPNGTMRFEKNRWLKVYEILDVSKGIGVTVPSVINKVKGKIRITSKDNCGGGETSYLTQFVYEENYEDVGKIIDQNEEVLRQVLNMKALTIDETMAVIMGLFGKKEDFSYVSEIRGKSNWKTKLFSEIKDEGSFFRINGTIGQCSFIMQYPSVLICQIFSKLKDLSCPVIVAYDLSDVTEEEKKGYRSHLEKQFNRRITKEEQKDYCNLSCMLIFLADSIDAKEIIEKTIQDYFTRDGFVISSCNGFEKEAVESMFSLGMKEFNIFRNVSLDVADEILSV